MGRKNNIVLIVLGVLIVAVVVGVLVGRHKDTNSSSSSTTSSTSTTTKSTATVTNAVVITKTDSSLGNYLAEPSGAPLYTFDSDTSGVSNCTGACLTSWPAYQDMGATTGLPTNISTLKRPDNGQVQFTYKGLPLYTFVNDTPGNPTGNNVSGFQVAKP